MFASYDACGTILNLSGERLRRTWKVVLGIFAVVLLASPALADSGTDYSSFAWKGFFDQMKTSAAGIGLPKNTINKPDRGNPFKEIRKDGGILVGLNCTIGDWFGAPIIQSIQPIYLTENGRKLGAQQGNSGGKSIKLEALDGYAVSSVGLHTDTHFIFTVQLTYMKIDLVKRGLDPENSYTSEIAGGDIVGHPGWLPNKQLGEGTPIIGLFGYSESEINLLGVISAPPTR